MSKWILIAETAIFGIVIAGAIPMWAMVPMLFGVTEFTSEADAKPIYMALLAFPVVAIGALLGAWFSEPGSGLRWVLMMLPIIHVGIIFAIRIKHGG